MVALAPLSYLAQGRRSSIQIQSTVYKSNIYSLTKKWAPAKLIFTERPTGKCMAVKRA